MVCARDPGDNLCGFSTAVTPATAPPVAHQDVLLGPWLAHAAEHVPDGNVILWRDSFDFTDDATSGIQGMLNMVWVLRSGLANPRWAYLPIDPSHPTAPVFSQALGGRHVQELDVQAGDAEFQCHVIDYGEGGLLGLQRSFVYMELGLPGARRTAAPAAPVEPEAVRDALRNLDVPAELARSPLATGEGIEARARSVRTLLETGASKAFGDAEQRAVAGQRAHSRLPRPGPQPRGGRRPSSTSAAPPTSGGSSRPPSGWPSTWPAAPRPA